MRFVTLILLLTVLLVSSSRISGLAEDPDNSTTKPYNVTQKIISPQGAVNNDVYIVNVGVVTDYEFYLINGSSTEIYINQIMEYAFELYYNISIPVYFELDIVLVMTSQSLSNSAFYVAEDKEGEIDPNQLLNNFNVFSESEFSLRDLDLTVLLSGRDFTGSTVGLGYRGVDPGTFSQNIIQGDREFTKLGETVAHEMGHNFGAFHDGTENSCSGSGFVMAPAVNTPRAEKFSSCSINEINNHLSTSWLSEVDSDPPVLSRHNYITLELGLLSPFWSISSRYADYYNVYVNNSLIETATWSLTHDITSSVSRSIGVQNVSIEVYDLMGRKSTDSFVIEIVDTTVPFVFVGHGNIEANETITILVGYSDNFLSINITDLSPGNLKISLDGTTVLEKSWNRTIWFEYDLNDLIVGDYILVINAEDTSGNNFTKEFKITVLPDPEQSSSSTTSETPMRELTSSNPSTRDTESSNPNIAGGSSMLGLISSFIIIPILKRKLL